MEMNRLEIMGHKFKAGVYSWKSQGDSHRAYIRFVGKRLLVQAETRVLSGWKPYIGIVTTKDLRTAMMDASARDIIAKI